jgi:hypothetical protein
MTRFALVSFLAGALSVNVAVAGDKPSVELGPTANLGGARLLPDDSPWHKDISGAPVDPNSDAILARIGLDAEGPFDDHGRILVTSEALARVTRSA